MLLVACTTETIQVLPSAEQVAYQQMDTVTTSKLRVVIEASKNPPLISEVGLFKFH